ncbi:hypothetical protein [Nocardioides alcanivorans]|uniref:hypothetical protein n=1 Tax=Nocardioides alcanivorans TaxID=2897352 RepID=UPI001F37C1FA|nr:hypothetical protein [Nocardioides alcanivorans]
MRLIHASGRYDRKVRIRRKTAKAQRGRSSLISRTESTTATVFRTRAFAALRRPGKAARGDCTIEHRRKRWKRLSARVVLVSKSYRLGRRCWVLVARMRRRSDGYPLTVITAHLPASVEGQVARLARRMPVTLDKQGAAWVEAARGLRRVIEEERRRRPNAVLVVTADWNINLRSKVQRDYLQSLLGDTVTLAKPDRPWADFPGTHGRRVIDWGACSEPSVVRPEPRTAASDHRPIRVVW